MTFWLLTSLIFTPLLACTPEEVEKSAALVEAETFTSLAREPKPDKDSNKNKGANIPTGPETAKVGLDKVEARVVELEISPKIGSMPLNTILSFKALAIYEDGSKSLVTSKALWSSSDKTIADFKNPSEAFQLSALKLGETTISASFESAEASIILKVVTASLDRIEITPKTILNNTEQKLYATAIFDDGSGIDITQEVSWDVSNPEIAKLSTERPGYLIALKPGKTSITASYQGKSTASQIEVRLKKLTELSLTAQTNVIVLGTTLQLAAEGNFEDDTTEDLTQIINWTSSNPEVASINNTNKKGQVTGLKSGYTTITGSQSGIEKTLEVQVILAQFAYLEIEFDRIELPLGLTKRLKAIGVLPNGTRQDITPNVIWNTSDAATATVSNMTPDEGVVTPVKKGPVTISVLYGDLSAASNLLVTDPAVVALAIEEHEESYICGIDTPVLKVMATYSDDKVEDISAYVTWSSFDVEMATVDNTAVDRGKVSTYKVGKVKVETTFEEFLTGKVLKAETEINAENPQAIGLTIASSSPSIAMGLPVQFVLLENYSCGDDVDKTNQATWISSAPEFLSFANVNGQFGLGSTHGTTATDISVTIGAQMAAVTINFDFVINPEQAISVLLAPELVKGEKIVRGDTSQFIASAIYTNGDLRDVTNQSFFFMSGAEAMAASVDNGAQKGLVTAVSEGEPTLNVDFVNGLGNTLKATKKLEIMTFCPEWGTRASLYCVYLGAENEDCNQTCAANSSAYHPATHTVFGAFGKQNQCALALDKLGHLGQTSLNNATNGNDHAIGCSLFTPYGLNVKAHYVLPFTTSASKDPEHRRVCACDY